MAQSDIRIANLNIKNQTTEEFTNSIYKFPFKVSISFNKLIEHIEAAAECTNDIKKEFAANILTEINKNPGIKETFNEIKDVKPYEKLISTMMLFVFPDAFWEKQTYALTTVFKKEEFFTSPKYREIIMNGGEVLDGDLNIDEVSFNFGRIVGGYAYILNYVYGFDFKFEIPIVYKIPHPETGLDRYFKLNMANEFADVIVKGKLRKFTEEERKEIYKRIYDIEFLKKLFLLKIMSIQALS